MGFVRIAKEFCFCVESIENEKLEDFFRIGQVAFVKNSEEKIIGIISQSDYSKGCINTSFRSIRYTPDGSYMDEVRKFFLKTNYWSIPVLNDNDELMACFVRVQEDYEEEDVNDKWINIANCHLAELVREKGFKKIRIYMINSLSEQIYCYFKYYEQYFDRVDKVIWYDVYETPKDTMVIANNKLSICPDVLTYSYASLQMELEYNLLLSNCKENNAQFYMFSIPTHRNVWNVSREEQERISSRRTWRYYLENKELFAELLQQVLDMEEEDKFINSCLDLPLVIKKNQLFYQRDHISEFVNVISGNRVTEGLPAHVQNHIYLAGNSFVFGPLVDDKNTIASHLQYMINQMPEFSGYAVVNEGVRGMHIYESLKRLNDDYLKKGDIIALFANLDGLFCLLEEDASKKLLDSIIIYHLEDIFNALDCNKRNPYFLCSPVHPNSFAYRLAAEYLVKVFVRKNAYDNWVSLNFKTIYEERKLFGAHNEEWKDYIKELKSHRTNTNGTKGAIIMNGNPLTYGHKYLIDYALQKVDHLYIFVVWEDKSEFSFEERFEMVKNCVAEQPNITILPSGQFLASAITFSHYFTRQMANPQTIIDVTQDVIIFGKYVAPALDITVRFAGEEPMDFVTAKYNAAMKDILPGYGITFCEIPRYEKRGIGVVSAAKVREAIRRDSWDTVKELVPETTYRILKQHYEGRMSSQGNVD